MSISTLYPLVAAVLSSKSPLVISVGCLVYATVYAAVPFNFVDPDTTNSTLPVDTLYLVNAGTIFATV